MRSGAGSQKLLLYTALGAGAGIVGVSAVQLAVRATSSDDGYSDPVKQRLTRTYAYLGGSLACTALAATALFRSGMAYRLASFNPMVVAVGSAAALIGCHYWIRSVDYYASPMQKHLALGTFIGLQALLTAPLAALGGPLLMRAALGTGAIVGSLSLTAATAPGDAYLRMTGPLTIGAGLVLGASLGSMFFPGSSLLYNVVMYCGLAVHGGFVFVRTQRLIDQAALAHPRTRFDPINDCVGIYVDTIAIFWRLAAIMSGSSSRKR